VHDQICFGCGSAPDPPYSAPPDSLAGIKGLLLKGRGGVEGEGKENRNGIGGEKRERKILDPPLKVTEKLCSIAQPINRNFYDGSNKALPEEPGDVKYL